MSIRHYALAAILLLGWSGVANADRDDGKVIWFPAEIKQKLRPGEQAEREVIAKIRYQDDDVIEDGIKVVVSRKLKRFVSVEPRFFAGDHDDSENQRLGDKKKTTKKGGKHKGSKKLVQTIKLKFSVRASAKPRKLQGKIILQSKGDGKLRGALPITLRVLEGDKTPPNVVIVTPADSSTAVFSPVVVSGTIDDTTSSLNVNNQPVTIAADGTWITQVALIEGSNTIRAVATDQAGNQGDASIRVTLDTTPPIAQVLSPANFSSFNVSPIVLTGTVDDITASIKINGVPTPVQADGSWSKTVALNEGSNNISITTEDPFLNTVTQSFVATLDTVAPIVVINEPIEGSLFNVPSIVAKGSVSDLTNTRVTVNGVDAIVDGSTWQAQLPLAEGVNTITALAQDSAGNTSDARVTVNSDTQAPEVTIISPANGTIVSTQTTTVTGQLSDESATLLVNGRVVNTASGAWSTQVVLSEGNNVITAIAQDIAGNQDVKTISVIAELVRPLVTISSPSSTTFNSKTITVAGTVDDPDAVLVVDGVPVNVNSSGAWEVDLSLHEGLNFITASATNTDGIVGTASIELTVDTRPPKAIVDFPPNSFVTDQATINVSGMLNDVVAGTVAKGTAQVTVNGQPAEIDNRVYLATNIPLQMGSNIITVLGKDAAGNTASTAVTVMRKNFSGPRIRLVSGNNQRGVIGTPLAEPIAVKLTDALGAPVVGENVIFKVIDNNGTLTSGLRSNVRSVAVQTDDQGLATTNWTVGTRAGPGNNVVEASAVRFAGSVIFTASSDPAAPAKINIDTGNNQTGVIGEPLARPFVAIVTDVGHNRLANVPVTFSVVAGGGSFNGLLQTTVNTDASGRAVALLNLGLREGIQNNVVEASYENNMGNVASFVASAKIPGDPANTVVSGVVLDNTNIPIEGVTIVIEGTNLSTQTDAQGQFSISGAPVGHILLLADGSTAQRPGTWPSLEFELFTIAGRENTIGMPVFLLPLDLPNGQFVDQSTGTTLTLPEVPGFSLSIEPGAATFSDGGFSGFVSVTAVHADKVPMTPNFGQQPRFIITIQPAGTVFDPPAKLTLPNTDGMAPGQVTELYSFDHDLGSFVSIGTGSVSEDGTRVVSDGGVGVIKAGWHCGGDPSTPGDACDCNDCQTCDGNACVDDELPPSKSVTVSLQLPNEAVRKLNGALDGLKKLPVLAADVSVTFGSLDLSFEEEPCCEPTIGKSTKYNAKVTGNLLKINIAGKVWPPGPIPSYEKSFSYGAFSFTAKGEFLGGVFVEANTDISGEVGKFKDGCSLTSSANREGCLQAEIGVDFEPAINAQLTGSSCIVVQCGGLINCPSICTELSGKAELSVDINISNITYNKPHCESGLSGGVATAGDASFNVPVSFKLEVEINGVKTSFNPSSNFLSCSTGSDPLCRVDIY